jgi:DNA-directed RNA polymerase subunit N (RpoN/RPB10)
MPIAHLYPAFLIMCEEHRAQIESGKLPPSAPIGYILDELGLTKQCCRTHIMTCEEFKNYYYTTSKPFRAPTIYKEKTAAPQAS